jgi:DNA repair photolyase
MSTGREARQGHGIQLTPGNDCTHAAPRTAEHTPIRKRTSTLHDFPYRGERRKCFHPWIINLTPPGRAHCAHDCVFCYAREAIYSDPGESARVYENLPDLMERDLARLRLAPPVLLSTTTDPCQPSAAVREQTRRVVEVLVRWGLSFALTTKGDPSFLAELPSFREHDRKAVLVSIEGPPEVLELLSPGAPAYRDRLAAVRRMGALGAWVGVRLDPYLLHVYQGLYGADWWERTERLLDDFACAAARHVVASTGRLDCRRLAGAEASLLERVVHAVREGVSPEAAAQMEADYRRGWSGTCRGYVLREDLRRELHLRLRTACEARGMTFASCQELPESCDSPGLPTCEGFLLPFCRKGPDGRFHPVEGCTANCHVACAGVSTPPCGCPELAQPLPYRPALLK